MSQSKSQFPNFDDGDVLIMISPAQTYKLHSHTLSRLSPYFKHQFESLPGAKLTAAARREGATPYYFELNTCTYMPASFGKFVAFKVSENGRVLRDNYNFPNLEVALGQDAQIEGCVWDWLFGTFYNIPPKFEDHNLATVLKGCYNLADAADSIGAIEHVREIVELALLRQDHALWRAIAAGPGAWVELGCRMHSQSIFCEAMVHLVGIWPRLTAAEKRNDFRAEVSSLCETKHAELDLAKQVIELRILGHYPSFLSRSHVDKPQRTSYSSDIYMWMSVSFFRQFFAQAMSECETRNAPDGGWKFYNAMATGGNAYLNHEDFHAFYQYFPMSSKACNVLEANMNVLKEDVKVFVKDLIVSRVHVKPEEYPVNWLTCAVIEKTDLPWKIHDEDDNKHEERGRNENDVLMPNVIDDRLGDQQQHQHQHQQQNEATSSANMEPAIAFDVNKAVSQHDCGPNNDYIHGAGGGGHAVVTGHTNPTDPLSPAGNDYKDLDLGRNLLRAGIGRASSHARGAARRGQR